MSGGPRGEGVGRRRAAAGPAGAAYRGGGPCPGGVWSSKGAIVDRGEPQIPALLAEFPDILSASRLQSLKGWGLSLADHRHAPSPCSVWLGDLCRGHEVSGWWWALAGRAGAAGDGAVAGGPAVRRGRGAGAGGGPAAGEHEVGLSVATALACRRRAGADLDGSGRSELPAVRRPA